MANLPFLASRECSVNRVDTHLQRVHFLHPFLRTRSRRVGIKLMEIGIDRELKRTSHIFNNFVMQIDRHVIDLLWPTDTCLGTDKQASFDQAKQVTQSLSTFFVPPVRALPLQN
ncbi:Borealin [Trichinella pseudospiralis]|uniref:Uncharacterized protein n=1 Tax=Trichinella pseudospiralis TaxID=6337 RepID=A0A0V1FGL8_TRIPS|nr:hypothetical protein T4D_4620 [Trichinella pseudospiralis]